MRNPTAFGDIVMVLEPRGDHVVIASAVGFEALGLEDDEVVGTRPLELVHPDDQSRAAGFLLSLAADGPRAVRTVIRLRHAAGHHRRFECDAEDLGDDPQVGGILVNARDVTERERTAALARLDAATHRDLLAARPLDEVLTTVCDELAHVFEASIVWVGTAEEDGRISVAASHGPLTELLGGNVPRWDDTPLGQGALGTAVRENRLVVVTAADLADSPYRDAVAATRSEAGVAIPLAVGASVLGALSLVFTDRRMVDDADVRLLEAVAAWLALAVSMHHTRAAERVRSAVLANMVNGVVITDADGIALWVNPAFAEQLGVDPADVIGRPPDFINWERQSAGVLEERARAAEAGRAWQGEIFQRASDGSLRRMIQTVSPVRDDDGAVVGFVAVHEDVTALREAEDRLDRVSSHDPLTGLPTRQVLLDRLERDLGAGRAAGRATMVASIDVDGLRRTNELHGFAAGDQVLEEVGHDLVRVAGTLDTVARHAGDHFVVVAPGLGDPDEALLLVDRIRSAVTRVDPDDPSVVERSVTIGVALEPGRGDPVEAADLLRDADLALHRAKLSGHGTVEFLDPVTRETLIDRWALLADLPRAVAQGQFVLHYQPQYDLATGRVACLEALVRWQHPSRGLLQPGQFLHLAEESGLVTALDATTRRLALAQLREWQEAFGASCPKVSLNVSATELAEDGLADRLAAVLAEAGVEPHQVSLEILERNVVDDDARRELEAIAATGLELAVDDFGAGYSSLVYLATLPITLLKLDRSLVAPIGGPDDTRASTVVAAAISLGHRLGLRVLAEGVETHHQLHVLRVLGCDLVQGYLLARPRPPEDVPELVANPIPA